MRDQNPCNICTHSDNCEGCIINGLEYHSGECTNMECMLNYDCGCLLNLDDSCKASTVYKEPGVWVMSAIEDDEEEESEK